MSTVPPAKIAVVGSINMDLVVPCVRLPLPGETVVGKTLHQVPGGKGGNQAVAAARLRASVAMIGCVGRDSFGTTLLENLRREQVDVSHVRVADDVPSGVAIIGVDAKGENTITIVPGANSCVTPADVRAAASIIAAADVLMLQLEIPQETVVAAVELAKKCQTQIVLDPAPAPTQIFDELFQVDLLCPNETEAAALTGMPLDNDRRIHQAAVQLAARGVRTVVITLGARGAYVYQPDGMQAFVQSIVVKPIDSTAAGDAFAAALAVKLAAAEPLRLAVPYACVAGALAASKMGAQVAMPTAREVAVALEAGGPP